jgi:hypothetical protein
MDRRLDQAARWVWRDPPAPGELASRLSTLATQSQQRVRSIGGQILDTAGRITGRGRKRSRWERAKDQAKEILGQIRTTRGLLIGLTVVLMAGTGVILVARRRATKDTKRDT